MQAWHESRTSLVATIQQLSAPQLLALLLCASFCVSILVIASNSNKGALTPVYEAPSSASAHTAPWGQRDRVADVDGAAGLQQRSGFAAKVLPFIAATSAGGILKGADTLWGPSERTDGVPSAGSDPSQPSAPGQSPSAGQPNSSGASLWPAVALPWAKSAQKDTVEALETMFDVDAGMSTSSIEAPTGIPQNAPQAMLVPVESPGTIPNPLQLHYLSWDTTYS